MGRIARVILCSFVSIFSLWNWVKPSVFVLFNNFVTDKKSWLNFDLISKLCYIFFQGTWSWCPTTTVARPRIPLHHRQKKQRPSSSRYLCIDFMTSHIFCIKFISVELLIFEIWEKWTKPQFMWNIKHETQTLFSSSTPYVYSWTQVYCILYTYYNLQESNWEGQLKGDWENTILPHAAKLGAKTIGTIGELLFSQIMYAMHHLRITNTSLYGIMQDFPESKHKKAVWRNAILIILCSIMFLL